MSCQMPLSINRLPGAQTDETMASSSDLPPLIPPACRAAVGAPPSPRPFLFYAWTSSSVIICWPV